MENIYKYYFVVLRHHYWPCASMYSTLTIPHKHHFSILLCPAGNVDEYALYLENNLKKMCS